MFEELVMEVLNVWGFSKIKFLDGGVDEGGEKKFEVRG